MRHGLKNTLKQTPIYNLYKQHLLPRQVARAFWNWTEDDERRLNFYQRLIKPGSTVFDVGANMGNRAKVFLRLRTHVIAVEPQPICADFLETALKNNPDFKLIRKALGPQKGEAEMLISDAHTVSSLSTGWIEATQRSGRFAECKWDEKYTVEIDTLDNIIASYGHPNFIKVDVEGYEFEVLSGLSKPVDIISIEFTPEYIENTYKCIEHISSISDTEFQVAVGESMRFELPSWVSKQEIKEILSHIEQSSFGDIYMRRRIESIS